MKKLSIAMVASLAGLVFVAVGTRNSAAAATIASQPVYRLYNRNTGEHFYTTSVAERNVDVAAGWTYESIGWTAPKTSSQPIYRVYNPNAKGGDHYYTKSKGEAQVLVGLGWKWDNAGKPVFYSGGTGKVYVAYNPNAQSGAHNYTTNAFEQKTLLNEGWKFSAVAWNALTKSDLTSPAPSTTTVNVTVNKSDKGVTLSSTSGYIKISSSSSSKTTTASNGDITITNTTTNIWHKPMNTVVNVDESGQKISSTTGYHQMSSNTSKPASNGDTTTTVVWHKPINTVVNVDESGQKISSTTGYHQMSSNTSKPASNGDTTTTVVWHKTTTITNNITINKADTGETLTSTAGYVKVSTSATSGQHTASNGDWIITNTYVVTWTKGIDVSSWGAMPSVSSTAPTGFSRTDLTSNTSVISKVQQISKSFQAQLSNSKNDYSKWSAIDLSQIKSSAYLNQWNALMNNVVAKGLYETNYANVNLLSQWNARYTARFIYDLNYYRALLGLKPDFTAAPMGKGTEAVAETNAAGAFKTGNHYVYSVGKLNNYDHVLGSLEGYYMTGEEDAYWPFVKETPEEVADQSLAAYMDEYSELPVGSGGVTGHLQSFIDKDSTDDDSHQIIAAMIIDPSTVNAADSFGMSSGTVIDFVQHNQQETAISNTKANIAMYQSDIKAYKREETMPGFDISKAEGWIATAQKNIDTANKQLVQWQIALENR